MENEFSVYWFDPDGGSYNELRFVSAERAVTFAKEFIQRRSVALDIVKRVIITDGGDCIVFEWKHGEGVTWPKEGQ